MKVLESSRRAVGCSRLRAEHSESRCARLLLLTPIQTEAQRCDHSTTNFEPHSPDSGMNFEGARDRARAGRVTGVHTGGSACAAVPAALRLRLALFRGCQPECTLRLST